MTTVDLVSGWVMVPLENVIQGRPIVKSYKMFGGTPFSPVKVNKKKSTRDLVPLKQSKELSISP